MMASAKGLVSTAGFESVCEAMYLNKPVLMVPVEGHFEQYCNSRDAFYAGAGLYDTTFDIHKLDQFASATKTENTYYKKWVNQSSDIVYKQMLTVLK
jgi:uncharacterized protein (TIGR00661 family)